MGFWLTDFKRAFHGAIAFLGIRQSVMVLIAIPIISAIIIYFRKGSKEFLEKFKDWFWYSFIPSFALGLVVFIWYFLKMPSTIINETKREYNQRIVKVEDFNSFLIKTNKDLRKQVETVTHKKNKAEEIEYSVFGTLIQKEVLK